MNKLVLAIFVVFFDGPTLHEEIIPQDNYAQSRQDNKSLRGDYLGEVPPGRIPKIFAPNLLSTNDLHSSLYFSPDGKEMYYTRLPSGGDLSGVFCRKQVDGKWVEVETIPNTENSLTPFLSHDGERLFLSKPTRLHVMKRTTAGWGEPIDLGDEINFQKRQDGISEAISGNIYYTSMFGQNDGTYIAKYSGDEYLKPEKIKFGLADDPATGYPYIAPDESYLILSSRVAGGYGASDLYIMFKNADGTWKQAINMGKTINTKDCESFPSVTPDGKYLFFNSNSISEVNSIVPGHFYCNIYWVDAQIIEELRRLNED